MYSGVAYGMYCGHKTELFLDNLCDQESDNLRDHKQTALVNNLKNIRDNKNRTRTGITIDEIFEYDLNSTAEELDAYCKEADFVFNLAGVNRPENPEDFMKGNFGFASDLLNNLKKCDNKATIMLSSSI